MPKKLKPNLASNKKSFTKQQISTDSECPIWTFKNIDRCGQFAFNPSRSDFDAEQFVCKLIDYSTMTWRKIKQQTNDKGKSKHHFLSPENLSPEAWKRIKAKHFEEEIDRIFSFALNNRVRIIGFCKTDTPEFQVIWYDAEHKFAPSKLKHT